MLVSGRIPIILIASGDFSLQPCPGVHPFDSSWYRPELERTTDIELSTKSPIPSTMNRVVRWISGGNLWASLKFFW